MNKKDTVDVKEVISPIQPIKLEEVNPNERLISEMDADGLKEVNKILTKLRMDLSESVILRNLYADQVEALNEKIEELNEHEEDLLNDFKKKTARMQKMGEEAAVKCGINLNETGWVLDVENSRFYKKS
jgi:hypothetical protein